MSTMGIRYRKPYSIWPGRLIRGRRLDRNPLRRGSDRAETVMLGILVAAFAVGAPLAASAAGAYEHTAAHREQQAQEAAWHLVPGVITSTPQAAAIGMNDEAPARWTAPSGATIISSIPVPPGTVAGSTVRIWVTRDGALTRAPLLNSQVAGQAMLAEIGVATGLAVTLAGIGKLARRSLDRHRIAGWDEEWRTVGPRWTARA